MPDLMDIPLACRSLGVSIPGRTLVSGMQAEFRRGEFVAVLGLNGSGKTLSMLTLAGLRRAESGSVLLGGTDITQLRRDHIARQLALLPQSADDAFPTTVIETVLVGRHPHVASLQWESEADYDIVRDALREVDLAGFEERNVQTLSGGERRRLAIAQVLSQRPQVYLLDEPTNHLDPHHQLAILQTFRRVADKGATVIASLHDVNLAARFADRCLLLAGDGSWQLDTVEKALNEESLMALYGTRFEAVPWRQRQVFVCSPGEL